MTENHDDCRIQTVTLDHDCAAYLVVAPEDGGEARVFGDLTILALRFIEALDSDRAMVDLVEAAVGERDETAEAMIAAKAGVIQTIIMAADHIAAEWSGEQTMNSVLTIADLPGFENI